MCRFADRQIAEKKNDEKNENKKLLSTGISKYVTLTGGQLEAEG